MYNMSLQLKSPENLEDSGTQIISSILHHMPAEDDAENCILPLVECILFLYLHFSILDVNDTG